MVNDVIQINHVSKVYRTDVLETMALNDVSFTVKKGEFVAIMGPSGSGKSTLMHIIGALDSPTTGTYFLDGKNVAELSDDALADIRNQRVGFIFQAFNLLPRTSALRNVMLPMAYAGVPKSQQRQRALRCLEMVGLSDRVDHTSNQLSGGQQQRVAIARALVMNPAILLADEPTGNIASSQAAEIMEIFQKIHREGHTIVMITHEPDIAEYAGRVLTIRDGELFKDSLRHQRRRAKRNP